MLQNRCLLSTLALTALIGCGAAPKVDNAAEVMAVRKRYSDWVQAEKRRDLEAAMSFLAPDAVVQGGDAPAIKGVEAARIIWKEIFSIPYTDMVDTEPRTVVVAKSGDMAYDAGNFKIIIPGEHGPTEVRAKSLVVWRKLEGQWMAVVDTWSMDAPPEPAPPSPAGKQ